VAPPRADDFRHFAASAVEGVARLSQDRALSPVLGVCAAAWLVIATGAGDGFAPMLCRSPSTAFAERVNETVAAAGAWTVFGARSLGWLAMIAAMMWPLTLGPIRHVRARSFPWRRGRAVAEFLSGYSSLWLIVGLAAAPLSLVIGSLDPIAADRLTVVVFLVAIGWQFTGHKAQALLRCHATTPLRAYGAGADIDCVAFGFRHGVQCAGSCWALMLAAMLATPALPAMGSISAFVMLERAYRRPIAWPLVLLLSGLASSSIWGAAGWRTLIGVF
jgi:predicted metal-binding membrane protein